MREMKEKSLVGWIEDTGKVKMEFSWNTLLISNFFKNKKDKTIKVRITIHQLQQRRE